MGAEDLPFAGRPPRTAPVGNCPLCSAPGARTAFTVADRLHGTPGEFTYRKCGSCGTVFQDPRVIPEDLRLCYPPDYYTHGAREPSPGGRERPEPSRGGARARDHLRAAIVESMEGGRPGGTRGLVGRVLARISWFRKRAWFGYLRDELLPRTRPAGRALEIGCGSGYLLDALGKVGWEAEGVEWDALAAEGARQRSGRPVLVGDFRLLDLPPGVYRLVVLSHVFEHLDRPVDALRRLTTLLAPGGRVAIFYPNPESLGARLFGRNWFPWEVPRHLSLPTIRALTTVARSLGLDVVRARSEAEYAGEFFSLSRDYRAGRRVDPEVPAIAAVDRALVCLERLALCIRLDVGEEAVVVLAKP